MHSTPGPIFRPCWHCTAFDGMTAQGTAALRGRPGCCRVRSQPETGCVCWVPAPSTEDEDWPPKVSRPEGASWVPWADRCRPILVEVVVDWAP